MSGQGQRASDQECTDIASPRRRATKRREIYEHRAPQNGDGQTAECQQQEALSVRLARPLHRPDPLWPQRNITDGMCVCSPRSYVPGRFRAVVQRAIPLATPVSTRNPSRIGDAFPFFDQQATRGEDGSRPLSCSHVPMPVWHRVPTTHANCPVIVVSRVLVEIEAPEIRRMTRRRGHPHTVPRHASDCLTLTLDSTVCPRPMGTGHYPNVQFLLRQRKCSSY